MLGASLLMASLVSGAAQRPPVLFFEWHAPESCPQLSWLLAEVGRLRGKVDVHSSPEGADVSAAATVSYLAARWTVRVDTTAPFSGTRTIEAESCLRAAEAAATVVSLALAPFAPPPPPPSAAPLEQASAPALERVAPAPPVPEPRWKLAVGAYGTSRFGLLPSVAAGAAISVGVVRSAFKLELELNTPAFETVTYPRSIIAGQLSVPFSAGLAGCRALTGEELAELQLCLTVEGGLVRGQGQHLDMKNDEVAPWLSTGALATLRVKLWGPVGARLDAGGGVSWSHPRFAFELPQGQQTLYPMPWFNARAVLGLELNWSR